MKKLLLLILCCGALSSLALRAGTIAPERVSASAIKGFLSEKYGCKIDKDGDLVVNGKNGKIFVEVLPKVKMIRLAGFYKPYDKRTTREMISLANQFNYQKRFMRISIGPEEGESVCDYYFLYHGGLNTTAFEEAIDWFESMMGSWETFVVNGGEKQK